LADKNTKISSSSNSDDIITVVYCIDNAYDTC